MKKNLIMDYFSAYMEVPQISVSYNRSDFTFAYLTLSNKQNKPHLKCEPETKLLNSYKLMRGSTLEERREFSRCKV